MTNAKSELQQRIESDILGENALSELENRQTKILASAVEECSHLGIKNLTIAGVAKRAGVSTATIYRYHKDKTELYYQCVGYFIPLLALHMTKIETNARPFDRIKAMLINHGEVVGDPYVTWLYRAYVSSETDENAARVKLIARAGRATAEAHWSAQLTQLEAEGYLRPSLHQVTINLLLGQIERRTMLAQLLFGADEGAKQTLEKTAHFAAIGLFENLGTPAFHDAFSATIEPQEKAYRVGTGTSPR